MIILLFFVFLGLTVLTILAEVEDLRKRNRQVGYRQKNCNVPKRKYKNRKSNGRACITVYEI